MTVKEAKSEYDKLRIATAVAYGISNRVPNDHTLWLNYLTILADRESSYEVYLAAKRKERYERMALNA